MKGRRLLDAIGVACVTACALAAIMPLSWLLSIVLASGWQALLPTFTHSLPPWANPGAGSLWMVSARTLQYLIGGAAISLPLAFAAGLYLEVLAPPGWMRVAGDRIARIGAAVPPLSWGVGLALIIRATGLQDASWPLILAFCIVILPSALHKTCLAFAEVERGQSWAAHALGATRAQVACTISLALAWPTVLAAYLRVLARSSGEAAPFVALFLYVPETIPTSLLPFRLLSDSGSPFTGLHTEAWAGVLLLLAFSAGLHLIAVLIKRSPSAR